MSDEQDLPAGDFAAWLSEMQGALRGEHASDVPCGGCTACCRAAQFIHVGPDETDTLAHIPPELLFPAPLQPRGHMVLGYDERGHCPMLVDDRCSIYEYRPQTCRSYDCRVIAATGIELVDADKGAVARQARRWRFGFPARADEQRHAAVRAAAVYLGAHPELIPAGATPRNATQLAVLAVMLHGAFLRQDAATGADTLTAPDPATARSEFERLLSGFGEE